MWLDNKMNNDQHHQISKYPNDDLAPLSIHCVQFQIFRENPAHSKIKFYFSYVFHPTGSAVLIRRKKNIQTKHINISLFAPFNFHFWVFDETEKTGKKDSLIFIWRTND